MKTILTAKLILTGKETYEPEYPTVSIDDALEAMVEFAKLHVEAALKQATENIRIIDDPTSYCGNTGSEYPPAQIIDKDSIINSYPLTNIK